MKDEPAAYELTWSVAHLGDDEHDAELVKFEGWEKLMGLMSRDEPSVPVPVLFEANMKTLRTSDFPSSDVTWPIVSRQMLDAIRSAGGFAHREVPVVMVDDTFPAERRYDSAGVPASEASDRRFVAIQVLEHLDDIDWEKSDFERSELAPGLEVTFFDTIVLRAREGGFPAMFRLAAAPNRLFVSAAAKKALDQARIRGVELTPVRSVTS